MSTQNALTKYDEGLADYWEQRIPKLVRTHAFMPLSDKNMLLFTVGIRRLRKLNSKRTLKKILCLPSKLSLALYLFKPEISLVICYCLYAK